MQSLLLLQPVAYIHNFDSFPGEAVGNCVRIAGLAVFLVEGDGGDDDIIRPSEELSQLCASTQYPLIQVAKGLQHCEL
jgi:hypothetical protein